MFIMLTMILTFMSVDKTLVCDNSNESYWAVLSPGIVRLSGIFKNHISVCFFFFNFKNLGALGTKSVVN